MQSMSSIFGHVGSSFAMKATVAAVAAAVSCNSFSATQYVWKTATDGSIDNPEMWDEQTAKNSAYIFDVDGSYVVGLDASRTNSTLLCFDGESNVTLSFGDNIWNLGGNALRIPYSSAGVGCPKVALVSGAIDNASLNIGFKADRPAGELNIYGPGSEINATAINLGVDAPGAKMTVANGATLTTTGVPTIGTSANGCQAELHILDGARFVVNKPGMAYVGTSGSCSNLLHVAGANSSATFSSSTQVRIGVQNGCDYNRVVVDGASMTCGNNLIAGNLGGYNDLILTNGATCSASKLYVGGGNTSYRNHALVDGEGTTMTVSGMVAVGMGGNENILEVANGGTLTAQSFSLNVGTVSGASGNAPSFGNELIARGKGTYVQSAVDCSIGHTNGNAKVTIADGAALYVKGGSQKFLYIGELGEATSNSLEIVSGGIVTNSTKVVIGNAALSHDNSILVSGPGSLLYQTAYIRVGSSAKNNSLTIDDGAFLNMRNVLYVGSGSASHGNVLNVSGESTAVTNTSVLYAGYEGCRNSVAVREGTFHNSGSVYVGYATTAMSNTLEIADGAYFYAGGNVQLGNSDASCEGNSIVIDNASFLGDSPMTIYNATLELKGSMPSDLSGEYVQIPRLTFNDGTSTLKFTGDRSGMPFLYNRKTSKTTKDIKFLAANGGSIVVDASECRNRGTYTLIDSPNPIPDALLENITASDNAVVYPSADKKCLYVDVHYTSGTIFLLK